MLEIDIVLSRIMKLKVLLTIAFVFLMFVISLHKIGGHPPYVYDELYYFSLANYILRGYGYRDACFINNPPHTKYPFVEPLILAGLIKLFDNNFWLLRIIHLFIGFLALIPVYWLFKKITNQTIALLVVILTVVSRKVFLYVACARADLPYAFFSFVFLYFIYKYQKSEKIFDVNLLLSVALIFLAYFTRYVGVALLITGGLYLLTMPSTKPFEKGFQMKKSLLFSVFSATSTLVVSAMSNLGGTYKIDYSSVAESFSIGKWFNILLDFVRCGYAIIFYGYPTIITGMYFPARNYFTLIPSMLIVAGFIYCLLKRRTIIEYYFFFYIGVLLLFPPTHVVAIRFLVPLAPLLFYYLVISVERLTGRIQLKQLGQTIYFLLVFLLISLNLFMTIKKKSESDELSKGTGEMVNWVKDNTDTESIFLSNTPHSLHLFANRKSVKYGHDFRVPDLEVPEKALKWIEISQVDYIVPDDYFGISKKYLYPVIYRYPDRFKLVYQKNVYSIYRVKR